MEHRHLNHSALTLAAIDDMIDRGRKADWADLRAAALSDTQVQEKVLRVCAARIHDPCAQRYHFWKLYVEQRRRLADMGESAVLRSPASTHTA